MIRHKKGPSKTQTFQTYPEITTTNGMIIFLSDGYRIFFAKALSKMVKMKLTSAPTAASITGFNQIGSIDISKYCQQGS